MEVRKLQTTAGGTFVITIPKEWIEKLKLRKGDHVSIELEGEDIIINATHSRMEVTPHSLQIDEFREQKLLELSITASYILGHDITEVLAKRTMSPEQKKWIKETIEKLIGVEISEEFANQIVLQNLVDPAKFDLNKLLERFSATSTAILQDAVKALIENDKALAGDAYDRGVESNRVYRLMMRLAFQAANDKNLRNQMNFPNVSSVMVQTMAIREMGRVAYYAMRIAQHVGEIDKRPDASLAATINEMTATTAEMLDMTTRALMNRNVNLASAIADRMGRVRKLHETTYLKLMKEMDEKNLLSISLITRDIRAIAAYAVAIADEAVLSSFA
jgi:phosphate uptake regulator